MEGLDVLAALKGTDMVLLDTVMQPEVLEQQMQQINDIYFKVFDELYDIIREGMKWHSAISLHGLRKMM